MGLGRRSGVALSALAATTFLVFAVSASGGGGGDNRAAALNGYQEVPSISTRGNGRARVTIEGNTIRYRLTYQNLEGTAQVAHIHFAQRHVNGAIVAFLCGGGGKPTCPSSGTVTGTITAADIVAVPAQGIGTNEIAEVIRAIRVGAAYVNVHTSTFGTGEIRGQIVGRRGAGDNGNGDRGNGNGGDDDD